MKRLSPSTHAAYTAPIFRAAIAALTTLSGLTLCNPTHAAPPKEPAYPKADPAHAFAEMKVYGKDGSPLRTPHEDWDGSRQRVAADPQWAAWLAGRRRDVDDWMAKRRDHSEWTAGWHHDFVSPKDGSPLVWTPDEPGEETLYSTSDTHVKLTPKLRAAWVYDFREKMADYIAEAARLYRLTGERKYADWAAAQLDFYADNFAAWPVSPRVIGDPNSKPQPGVHLMWQSLDEAVSLTKYVDAARTLGDYVTPERKQKWSTLFFLPDATLLMGTMHLIHNIATWHRAAMGFVAVYTGDAALWKAAVEDPFGVRDELLRGVTSDYLWREQSFGYNIYVARALTPFFIFAVESGYGPKLTREMETTENLLLSPLYMRFPTGQEPNPCDEGAPSITDAGAILADFARIYPTAVGVASVATHRDWETLLDPATPASGTQSTSSTPELPPVKSENLESARMAVLKRGPWQVFVHYGQITTAHSQAEALNYEAFYDRTDVSHDPGTTRYGSALHGEFFATGLAHNVPLVDGRGEKGIHLGDLLGYDGDAGTLSVAQPQYGSNSSAQRDISLANDHLADTVTVKTTDGVPHELGLLLQTQGVVTLPSGFQPDPGFATPGPTRPVGFKFWTNVTSAAFIDTADFDITYPDGRILHQAIHLPGKFTVTHATTLDSPPKKREVLFVHVVGTSAVFQTALGAK